MTGTSPSRTERQAGFTLVELLAVIAVMGLLATLAVAQYGRAPTVSATAGGVLRAKALLEAARMDALSSSRVVTLGDDALSGGLRIVSGEGKATAASGPLTFYPDGSSSGALIMLHDRPVLRVEWISGFVHGVS
jgi:prepilin-type N-terminal cleavage/methylation domain-containing protein